jgi:hypothetical protein
LQLTRTEVRGRMAVVLGVKKEIPAYMHWEGKKRATVLRAFAAGLGAFVMAGASFATIDSPFINHGPVFAADDPNCQVVEDASNKQLNTPYHLYSADSIGTGPPKNGEGIFVDGVLYSRPIDGKWTALPVPQRPPKDKKPDEKKPHWSCQHLRDESANGEDAGVYGVHWETGYGNFDELMWISKGTGLPLRMDLDFIGKSGDGKSGDKRHLSIRYDYNNVQKPKF